MLTFGPNPPDDILQKASQGWSYFEGNFYYFSHTPKTWYSAQQSCMFRNSHLTSVTSKSEQVSVVSGGSVKGCASTCLREAGPGYAVVMKSPKYW